MKSSESMNFAKVECVVKSEEDQRSSNDQDSSIGIIKIVGGGEGHPEGIVFSSVNGDKRGGDIPIAASQYFNYSKKDITFLFPELIIAEDAKEVKLTGDRIISAITSKTLDGSLLLKFLSDPNELKASIEGMPESQQKYDWSHVIPKQGYKFEHPGVELHFKILLQVCWGMMTKEELGELIAKK